MSIFEDSKTDLHVVRAANATALRAALTAGTMGGFYATGTNAVPVVAALTALAEYEYCSRDTRGALRKSPAFTPEMIFNATYMLTTARTEQITYLGWNGVAGAMDAANSTYYGLKIILDHTFGMLNNSPMIVTVPYKTDATATQRELAAGLAIAGTATFKRQAFKPLKIERVNAGATLLVHNNLAFVNGSSRFTSTDDDTLTLLTGSVLRVSEPEGALALTDPCYVITGNDGGAGNARIYYLDQEFQGATNADNDTCETVTEGAWGLKFTGISVTDANFNPVTDEPFVSSFTLETGDFTTATVTYTTAPFIGRGTYQQVSYEEAHMQFQNKTREVSAYPPTVRDLMAVAGEGYNIFTFDVVRANYLDATTGQRPLSRHRIRIAVLSTVAAELAEYLTVLSNPGIMTGNPA